MANNTANIYVDCNNPRPLNIINSHNFIEILDSLYLVTKFTSLRNVYFTNSNKLLLSIIIIVADYYNPHKYFGLYFLRKHKCYNVP